MQARPKHFGTGGMGLENFEFLSRKRHSDEFSSICALFLKALICLVVNVAHDCAYSPIDWAVR
jgi:hypothetical protein